jgi:hypothetical protein
LSMSDGRDMKRLREKTGYKLSESPGD